MKTNKERMLEKAFKELNTAAKDISGGKIGVVHNIKDVKALLTEEELNEMYQELED
jgi:hypothetical protein